MNYQETWIFYKPNDIKGFKCWECNVSFHTVPFSHLDLHYLLWKTGLHYETGIKEREITATENMGCFTLEM